jgi:hypothetical protein
MRRWVTFTTLGDQNGNNHQKGISFGKIYKDINPPNPNLPDANTKIGAVYSSGEFVSLFAAVSPEEDFAETYKYKVLAAAQDPNTFEALDLAIATNPRRDVLGAVRNPAADLGRKINCINLLIQ